MLEQLRYSGVFEAVTIRKSGYPFRLKLDTFVAWYKCLLLDTSEEGLRHFRIVPFRDPALQSRAAQILEATGQDFTGVRYGHTMVCSTYICAICICALRPHHGVRHRAKEHRTYPYPCPYAYAYPYPYP